MKRDAAILLTALCLLFLLCLVAMMKPAGNVSSPARAEALRSAVSTSQSAIRPDACQAAVTRVIDGDTFVCVVSAQFLDTELVRTIEVRLADVNCPEIHDGHGNTPEGKAAGLAAAAYTKAQLEGRTVTVQPEHTDSFGRWITHVTIDGRDFNAELIAKGYAVPFMVGK